MTLSVWDTKTGGRVEFEVAGEEVLLYVCGLTVSDDAHMGHARLWFHADILHRWLAHEGYDVRHVENVTDVNEKITARVGEREEWESEADVARHYTERVLEDMRSLNLERAEVYPRVSEHVPEIVALIETLVETGYAYESNGSVYFDVTAFEEYGALSNQSLDELESQGDPDEQGDKRNPSDFALWKAGGVDAEAVREHSKHDHDGDLPTGQTWDSPWGEGRPGWHIECSVMSTTHLGDTLDVHMGGRDLVFPHHENEIAQSEAATGQTFARYWLHVGLLQSKLGDEETKMSSSLGNFLTIREAIEEFGVDVVRTFYLNASYRGEQTYSAATLEEASERWDSLRRAYETAVAGCDSVDAATTVTDDQLAEAVETTRRAFTTAMNDDLDVRSAYNALLELGTAVNRHVEDRKRYDYRSLRRAVETFEELGGEVFGLSLGRDASDGGTAQLRDGLIELVLDVREDRREAGDYDTADEIRDRLDELGVTVEDSSDGPDYRIE